MQINKVEDYIMGVNRWIVSRYLGVTPPLTEIKGAIYIYIYVE